MVCLKMRVSKVAPAGPKLAVEGNLKLAWGGSKMLARISRQAGNVYLSRALAGEGNPHWPAEDIGGGGCWSAGHLIGTK
jgi:hypothetical protein